MAASCLVCITRIALPEKPGKVSFVCIVGRAVLFCDGCGLAVWPYITGRSKTMLYGEYSTGGAFELPTQSTINIQPYNIYDDGGQFLWHQILYNSLGPEK